MSVNNQNPYVGPRSFRREEGHLFYGRDREARDLLSLVASEQLVLFYAQSGAGKSSLLNTRLVPNLEAKNFEVLRIGRVSGKSFTSNGVENIFVFNLVGSLIQQDMGADIQAGLTLKQLLAGLVKNDDKYCYDDTQVGQNDNNPRRRRALLIDQFEEIFTTHPSEWKKRDDFFVQLAQAMEQDPYLTIILIMRDDYIASLDPYAHHLPGGLRIRYYMQRLNREAALKAIKNPVANTRPFAAGVAEKLVDDLASILVRKTEEDHEIHIGQYVEPVQLQVVCYGLWQDLPPEGTEITADNLLEVGDVDQSLERFYDLRVAAVAEEKGVPERSIREWIEKELITSGRTRNMVLQKTNGSGGLRDDVIQAMRGDLLRGELRAGQIWYELSHDRLIKPVISSNAKWFEQHLSLFQRRVVLWAEQGKSESLLLRGDELKKAEKEATLLSLTKEEEEFLDECRTLRKRELRDQRQRRVIFVALIVSVVLLALAVLSTINANAAKAAANNAAFTAVAAKGIAVSQQNTAVAAQGTAQSSEALAKSEAQRALAGSLVAQADSIKNSDHAAALLLGLEAYNRNPGDLTTTTLFNLLQYTSYQKVSNFNGPVNSAAVSPDGKWIATASCNEDCSLGEIQLFDDELQKTIDVLPGTYGILYSLAFYQYQDRLILAAAGCDPKGCSEGQGQISFWEIGQGNISDPAQIKAHNALVKTIAFSPDGKYLASGSYDTTVLLWDLTDAFHPQPIGNRLDHPSFVNDVAFSPDGNYLAVAGDDRTVYVWDVSDKNSLPLQPHNKYDNVYTVPVTSIAFSPDGKTFASGGYDNLVRLWDWASGSLSLRQGTNELKGHTGYVSSVVFNRDGTQLASSGFDSKILLWDVAAGQQIGPPLSVHTKAINEVVFGEVTREGRSYPELLSVGNDRTAILWDLLTRNPVSIFQESSAPENQIFLSKPSQWWKDMVCAAAKRNLTEAEQAKYLPNFKPQNTCPDNR